MRKNIEAIITAFTNDRAKGDTTCSTDGKSIYSYEMLIAHKNKNGLFVLSPKDSPSRTTSSQIKAVMAFFPSATVVSSIELQRRYHE